LPITPEKRDPGTQYIGNCLKCVIVLEVLEKIKIHRPCCGWTHYSPVFSPADEINIKAILNDIYQDLDGINEYPVCIRVGT
jgi:hypothetical protein